jgi:hypothetical protein
MVRSLWVKSVIGALALAGHAWGQATPYVHTAAGQVKERIITVQEMSKPGQRCKILKTWHLPDGAQAYQVQALETGEMMTIVETGILTSDPSSNGPRIKAVSTRIYHWSGKDTPPKGAPVAPENATVLGMPLSAAGEVAIPTPSAPREEAKSVHKTDASRSAPFRAPGATTSWRQWPGTVQESVQEAARVADSSPPPSVAPVRQPAPASTVSRGPATPSVANPVPPTVSTVSRAPVTSSPVSSKPAPRPTSGSKQWPSAYASAPEEKEVLPPPVANSAPVVPHPPVPVALPEPAPVRPVEPPPRAVTRAPEPEKKPVVKAPEPVQKPTPSESSRLPQSTETTKGPQPEKKPAPEPVIVTGTAAKPEKTDKQEVKSPTIVIGPKTESKPAPTLPTITTKAAEPKKERAVTLTRLPETPAAVSSYQQATPAPKPDASKTSTTVQATTEPAKPSDWRQSWGQVDKAKPASEGPRLTVGLRNPPRTDLPHADASRPDPLKNLEPFSKETLAKVEKKTEAKPDVILLGSNTAGRPASLEPVKPADGSKPVPATYSSKSEKASQPTPPVVVTGSSPRIAPLSEPQTGWEPKPQEPKPTTAKVAPRVQPIPVETVQGPPVQGPPVPAIVPGTGSVAAAGGPVDFVPPPVVPVPVGPPPVAPVGPVPQAPQPNRAHVEAAMLQAPPAVDAGVPPGMANAFTKGGTSRPLPADFGTSQPVANAFHDPAGTLQPQTGGPMVAQAYGPPRPFNPVMMVPGQQVTAAPPVYLPPEATVNVPQMLAVLRDSIYPSQRQAAIEQLAGLNWKTHPEVVQSLLTAAREDPAPMVRADCVRGLVRMKANSLEVGSVLEALKADPDQGVRLEVEQAIPLLSSPQAVQPASGHQSSR